MKHVKVFDTPEARAAGHHYECFCVMEETVLGILANKGRFTTVFLPWSYLARHGYKYVYEGEKEQ